MTYNDALAQEIRAELARRQLSRSALIRAMQKVSPNLPSEASLHRMIRGQYAWDVNSLDAVAQALGLSIADLLKAADAVYRCSLPSLSVATNPQVRAMRASVG